MKLRPDVEQLAQKIRNEQSYDDFPYGMEPIPGDHSWKHKKSPNGGLDGSDEAIPA